MNKNIRDLLQSENRDDVALGLIIAHREEISVKEIDRMIFDSRYPISIYRKTYRVFGTYLQISGTGHLECWKEEMFI